MKKLILILTFYCVAINVTAQYLTDTISLKMKLVAIDSYDHIEFGVNQKKSYLLLLEPEAKNLHLLNIDSSSCKNRIVADYEAFNVKNIEEGKYYHLRIKIIKPERDQEYFEEVRNSIGMPSNCNNMNLQKRWDLQYWVIDVKN